MIGRTARRCALLLLAPLLADLAPARAAMNDDFRCGGRVEADTWALWHGQARGLIGKSLIEDGLKSRGDSYVLYDLQTYLHNLVSMAARCQRRDELQALARWMLPVFDELSELPGGAGKAWICRGGRVCNAANRLQGREVPLTSAQFLVLAMRLASALAPFAASDVQARAFVDAATRATLVHLDRWSSGSDPLRLAERLPARAASVRDASSRLFYNDTDLWMLALYAEVGGTASARADLAGLLDVPPALQARRRETVRGLLRLLAARTSVQSVETRWTGRATAADLDRGFWRLYADNRFAGYEGTQPPAGCQAAAASAPSVAEQPAQEVGWDLSHARRLVHAFDAIGRQRDALVQVFGVPPSETPPPTRAEEFATQLTAAVWNGDTERPLFRNYWNGSNGWYRVGYARGGGNCFDGYPPYGLTDAFPTGGFATWSRHRPVLGALAQKLHALAADASEDAAAFIARHYPGLSAGAPGSTRSLHRLMFWPSLVQAADSSNP